MARGGGGRGRGGGRGGGYGRRDARPSGAASRDDRDRRDYRRPRSPSPGRRPRSPSPDRRPRRPRAEDDDRGNPRSARIGYIGVAGGRSPPRRGHTGCGDRHSSPRRARVGDDEPRDLPGRGPNRDYGGGGRHVSPRGARDYGGGGRHVSPRGGRDYGGDRRGSPRGPRDYERAPYREDHDRYDRGGRGGDYHPGGSYNAPPAYMLPDHPSDLGRPSLRAARKESDYFGGPSDRTEYFKGSSRRNTDKESDFLGNGGGTLRIRATESGRTSSMYPDSRSPPPRVVLSPPPPLYPSVPPSETGFLTGGSAMEAVGGFGAGSNRLLPDGGDFKYRRDLPDSYVERSRELERGYPASRDVAAVKDGGADRLYSGDVPARAERETEGFYPSRGMLGSDLVPGTQPKLANDPSSSLLAKDQPYGMHHEPRYEPSNGYIMDGLGHGHRFLGSSLERDSVHSDEALLDIARHATRAESMEYDAQDEYVTREPVKHTYVASENLRVNVSHNSRHVTGSTSVRGFKNERIDCRLRLHEIEDDEDNFPAMHHDTEHNLQPYEADDASFQYLPTRDGNGRLSHSPGIEPIGIARRPARHEFHHPLEDLSDQEGSPMLSRKRYRSPAYGDMYQDDDGFTRREYYSDEGDEFGLSPKRMSRSEDEDEYGTRYVTPSSRNVFSRLAPPHESGEEWIDPDQGDHPHSNILAHGRSKYIPMSQRLSRPNSRSQFGGLSMHGRGRGSGGGLTKSEKKRLKMAPRFHGGFPSERNESMTPNKFPKLSEDDDPNGSEPKPQDGPEHEDLPLQKDAPEGSEEFRKQVEQAFVKYAKIINESPNTQKKYREASKGTLSCCVCGSVARKFQDLDALLSHAYDTCKVGLRTKHLGLHKALCVLMGWNWHVAPDTSKAHHYITAEEVKDMKEDFMLWPPVVVMHNSSIANKAKGTEAKIVSVEEIEGVLADIGVPREKVKITHGRPSNQNVFLVKFQPTISGFQEALRTHNYFSSRNHGKEEFQEMRGGKGKKAAPIDNLEELLYAHIAVVEDLVNMDEETKKRCIIRSRKDIEAKADATLNLQP